MKDQALAKGLSGRLILPDSPVYDEQRKVWNGVADSRPSIIVQPAGAQDIARTLQYARENNLPLSIKGGGHSVAGLGACDAGVMLDMSCMKATLVDAENQTVTAGAGLTWGELDTETQQVGLATTGAVISSVGIAGSTLGGGYGWLMGRHGLACDNVLSMDLVDAQGDMITASKRENADLFWALRGGGGNFGVVTSITYQLHPVAKLMGGFMLHPLHEASAFLDFFTDFYAQAPDDMLALVMQFKLTSGLAGIGAFVAYPGSLEQGEKVLAPLQAYGKPMLNQIKSYDYCDLQKLLDFTAPHGNSYRAKSSYINLPKSGGGLPSGNIFSKLPQKDVNAVVELQYLPKSISQIQREDNAFGHRHLYNNLVMLASWALPGENELAVRWLENGFSQYAPYFEKAVYVNYIGNAEHEPPNRVADAYTGATLARLKRVKARFDPENCFNANQNILPAD